MKNEQQYLQQCRSLIEKKTGWGSHDHWTNQDFVRLSELIFEETGINLSSTTLKRIWGRVKYNSFPHITTLNALVKYAGYACWRAFMAAHNKETTEYTAHHQLQTMVATEKQHTASQEYKRDRVHIARAASIVLLLMVGVLALLGAIFSTYDTSKILSPADSKDFSFSAHPVTTGLPNTVIFNYNASAAATDSIYIQASADPQHKRKVTADKHQHTALYYYPGSFQTKLLMDDQVVKEQEVLIKTKGWLALVEHNPVPLYFKENIVQQGALGIPVETLKDFYPDMQTSTPWVAYYNVGNFGDLQSDNFTLETELKSDFSQGEAICQDTSVVILRSNAPPITIPLAIPGCLANVDRELQGGAMQNGLLNLTAFGCDFSDWVHVKCEAKDQQFRLWINQKLAYEGALQQDTSKIAGILYRFHGSGSINSLRIGQANGQMIYEEDFAG